MKRVTLYKKLLIATVAILCVIVISIMVHLQHVAARSANFRSGASHRSRSQQIAKVQEEVKRDPNNSYAHETLAGDYDLAGNRAKAIEEYQETVRLNPDDVYATSMLAHLLVSVGRRAEGRAVYAKLAAQGDAGAQRNLQEMDAMKSSHQ